MDFEKELSEIYPWILRVARKFCCSIQENRAFRKASYDDANLTKSQSIRHFSALDFIFLTANRPSPHDLCSEIGRLPLP